MNHLQLQEAALPDLSESQISRLPKDQLAHFSRAVQQLQDWTLQMRGRINRAMEIRYADQIRQVQSLGQEEAAKFRIDDGDLQIDVSQPKEIVWDQKHLGEIAERMVVAGDRVQDFMQVHFSVAETDYARWQQTLRTNPWSAPNRHRRRSICRCTTSSTPASVRSWASPTTRSTAWCATGSGSCTSGR